MPPPAFSRLTVPSRLRSVSGVAPTTNCMVMPAAPPGWSGSRGLPSACASRSRTTSARTRSKSCSVVAKLFSGAICARLAPQGASRLSDTRLASAVSRSICDRLGAGHQLHVDVPAEAVPLAQQLEHRDEIVHHLDRPARDAGGDEQPLAPPALMRAEEDADQLLGLEQGARHGPVPAHGAVVAVVAAGVGHEDAEQRHPHARGRAGDAGC